MQAIEPRKSDYDRLLYVDVAVSVNKEYLQADTNLHEMKQGNKSLRNRTSSYRVEGLLRTSFLQQKDETCNTVEFE